jgi:hypothetical protein
MHTGYWYSVLLAEHNASKVNSTMNCTCRSTAGPRYLSPFHQVYAEHLAVRNDVKGTMNCTCSSTAGPRYLSPFHQ